MNNPSQFLTEAKQGVVTVVFKKINSDEIRVMPCTLNKDLSNGNANITDTDPNSDHFAVWCLDKDAWRSFRANTVIEWYKGYPENNEL